MPGCFPRSRPDGDVQAYGSALSGKLVAGGVVAVEIVMCGVPFVAMYDHTGLWG